MITNGQQGNVGALAGGSRSGLGGDAMFCGKLAARLVRVKPGNREGGRQVRCHGQAHSAQADDGDLGCVVRHGRRLSFFRKGRVQTLRSVSTTAASASSSPTFPAKTMYGMPFASPVTGSQSEMMPGSMVPRHQARRIPRPSVAVSDDVMPPFATTNAG